MGYSLWGCKESDMTDPFTFIFFTISATWERGVGDKGGEIGASVVYEGAGAIWNDGVIGYMSGFMCNKY